MNYQHSEAETKLVISVHPDVLHVDFNGTALAESRAALVLREPGYPPRYYFPRGDVKMKMLQRSDITTHCPHKGDAEYFNIKSDGGAANDAAWSYPAARLNVAEISGYISFYEDIPGLTIS